MKKPTPSTKAVVPDGPAGSSGQADSSRAAGRLRRRQEPGPYLEDCGRSAGRPGSRSLQSWGSILMASPGRFSCLVKPAKSGWPLDYRRRWASNPIGACRSFDRSTRMIATGGWLVLCISFCSPRMGHGCRGALRMHTKPSLALQNLGFRGSRSDELGSVLAMTIPRRIEADAVSVTKEPRR